MEKSTRNFLVRCLIGQLKQGKNVDESLQSINPLLPQSIQPQTNNDADSLARLTNIGIVPKLQLLQGIKPSDAPGLSQHNPSFVQHLCRISDIDTLAIQIDQLFKHRLNTALSYAIFVLLFAIVAFSVGAYNLIPQLVEMLDGFGSQPPSLTMLVLDWYHSPFPPHIICGLILLLVILLMVAINQPQNSKMKNKIFGFIPLLKPVQKIRAKLKLLADLNNLALQGKQFSCQQLVNEVEKLNLLTPNEWQHLQQSQTIGTEGEEIDYLVGELEAKAENKLVKQSRIINGFIMGFVFIVIGISVIAMYMPIFQLGATL